MASNLPSIANIIDCPPKNDDTHSLQAHVSLPKVHGEDGAVMEAQGTAESIFSPIILNANISNVHGHHDLSALLLESQLDDISEGVDDVAREEASIHDIEDGTIMEAQGLAESVSPSILNDNISNVHGCHGLSALLLESRLDDINEGVCNTPKIRNDPNYILT
ncbi:hypothetical protein F0562_025415 [Nyssa sinensis]|uniref:Uncharacterized protein n=1 Tax=Nyssa sinensis TaxID=561372 RepID=A0A5J5BI76_9ASTE|nr:hypothetical protein F0562_025415 [Nyssa sinensis]